MKKDAEIFGMDLLQNQDDKALASKKNNNPFY